MLTLHQLKLKDEAEFDALRFSFSRWSQNFDGRGALGVFHVFLQSLRSPAPAIKL
jgi:hypothetical protein